ncbi:hypothetical protein PV327_011718 [Microctonus hyperodae]|uniref:Uncharacterized protein n=1 Tax=Microctonus hyperodae TaxID=165561 RepID=A0AA39KPQ0_MICHY|nr:hypothetical protein PV327_011718 [Microctonus hyperodae]
MYGACGLPSFAAALDTVLTDSAGGSSFQAPRRRRLPCLFRSSVGSQRGSHQPSSAGADSWHSTEASFRLLTHPTYIVAASWHSTEASIR